VTTPIDPAFIPPDPDEPIPQPPAGGGATDAGLGGVLVTDTDEIDAAIERLAAALADTAIEATAGMPGAPTWAQVYKLAHSMLAKYAPGRRGENINDLTYWYYGSWAIAAAFCFIFISYVLAHALSKNPTAAQQNAGLQLIGGKKAYVPYIRNVPGYHAGHSGMDVGAIVAVSGFNHIGFCVRVGGGTFDLLSGNSTDGSSDDAITIKRYSLSAASGYVNLRYSATAPSQEETMYYVGLKLSKPQAVKAGTKADVAFDVESSDRHGIHTGPGPYPGMLKGAKNSTIFTLEVQKCEGVEGTYQLVETDPKKNYAVHKSDYAVIPIGTPHTYVGICDPGMHLYLRVTPTGTGSVDARIKAVYQDL
jgi:hypothetical protein